MAGFETGTCNSIILKLKLRRTSITLKVEDGRF